MRTVYVLGAGASAQFTEGSTPVPVTRTFMKAAHDRLGADFQDVLEFLVYLYGPNVDEARVNVEEVLSVVDLGRGRPEGIGTKYSRARLDVLYERLIEMVWRTLQISLRGPRCSKHQNLVAQMGIGDRIISFNWDILIDNALSHDRQNAGLFDATCGYGFEPTGVEVREGEWFQGGCGQHTADSAKRLLFKLHGSMNWLRCLECEGIYIHKARKASYDIAEGLGTCRVDSQVLRPMIVPFTWAKKFDIKPYAQIWRGARVALQRAQRIVVIGYSLPDADFHARDLFLRSLSENTDLKSVDLVDMVFSDDANGDALRDKFHALFRRRIDPQRCFPSIDAFLGAASLRGDIAERPTGT